MGQYQKRPRWSTGLEPWCRRWDLRGSVYETVLEGVGRFNG
jgi:hypothetical protein